MDLIVHISISHSHRTGIRIPTDRTARDFGRDASVKDGILLIDTYPYAATEVPRIRAAWLDSRAHQDM